MAEETKQTNDRNIPETEDYKEEPSQTASVDQAETSTAAPAEDTEQPAMEGGISTAAIDMDVLRLEIENLRQQMEEARDRMLRTQAEMDNLRKRTAREVENAHKYALSKFVGELLPVLDSLELGLSNSNSPGGIEALREGMDLTLKKFLATLEKFGVSTVDPLGDRFNPEKHEAVTMQTLEAAAPGTVINVMQKGYELNGRLVRPAMVIVAK